MAERLFDLPETKGQFQLRGIVSGVESDRFYNTMLTKNGKQMRTINFSVNYNENNRLYLNLMGIEQDNVFFYSNEEKKTERVPWRNRFSFNKEGYRLIGTHIGVKKVLDNTSGEYVNDRKLLTDFDACEEVAQNLKDGKSVFTRGDLSFRSYINRNGDRVSSINLNPKQISLCPDIDFNDERYSQQNDFNQVIVFMGIDKEVDDSGKQTGRFVVSAKIVTYSTIEDAEFIIENSKLANMFRKNLKPYNSIKVSGHMIAEPVIEEVEDDDEWGESDAMERVVTPVRREFIITGAKGSTLDRDTYTEENISEAISAINKSNKAENDYGKDATSEDWGDVSIDDVDEESAW